MKKALVNTEAANLFLNTINNHPQSVLVVNKSGGILQANNNACLLYEYSRDELQEMQLFNLCIPTQRRECQKHLETVFVEGLINVEVKHLKSNGEIFDCKIHCKTMEYQDEIVAMVYLQRFLRDKLLHQTKPILLHESLQLMSSCETESELINTYCKLIHKLQPDSVVFYSKIVSNGDALQIAGLHTSPKLMSFINKSLKRKLVGRAGKMHSKFYELKKPGLQSYRHGGVASMSESMFDKMLTKMFAKVAGYEQIYGIGTDFDGDLFGAAGIIIPSDAFIYKTRTIESLNSQFEFCLESLHRKIELQKSEQNFKSFLTSLPEFVFEVERNGDFRFVNQQGLERFPVFNDENEPVNLLNYLVEEDLIRLKDNFEIIFSGKSLRGNTYRVRYKDQEIHVKIYSNPIYENGVVKAIRGIAFDISAESVLMSKLNESQNNYHEIFDGVTDGIMQTDSKGNILNVNAAFCRMLEVEKEDLLDKNVIKLVPEVLYGKSLDDALKAIRTVLAGHQLENMKLRLKGRRLDVRANKNEYTGNTISLIRDFSDLYEANEELERSEFKYKSLYIESPLPYQSLSSEGEILEVNPAWEDMLGYERHEVIGKHFSDFLTIESKDKFEKQFSFFVKQGVVRNAHFKMLRADMQVIDVHLDGRMAFDENKEVQHSHCVLEDITERLRIQREIRNHEDKLLKIYGELPLGTVLMDEDYRIEYLNDYTLELTGYSTEELQGETCEKICIGCEKCPRLDSESLTLTNVPADIKHKNGTLVKVLKSYRNIELGGRNLIMLNFLDVSEMEVVKMENEYYESNLQKLLRLSRDDYPDTDQLLNIAIRDVYEQTRSHNAGILLYFKEKDRFEMRSFYMGGEFRNHNKLKSEYGKGLLSLLIPDFDKPGIQILNNILYDYQLPDFLEGANNLLACPVTINSNMQAIVFLSGKDGDYSDNDARIVQLEFDIVWKILIQKKNFEELKIAKRKAEESDRLKSAFLANMSHEIRTPMNGIIGFADLLSESDETDEERDKYIDFIQKNGRQLLALINDIIDLSKIEANQLNLISDSFSLCKLLESVYLEFKSQNRNENLEFIFVQCKNNDVLVNSDEIRVRQIISNFMSNAVKFTTEGHVKLWFDKTDHGISIHVEDTGIGLSKDQQKMIFDRFYQVEDPYTKQYAGAGLGLAICNQLSELLGGSISLESEVGSGSVFTLNLPVRLVVLNG